MSIYVMIRTDEHHRNPNSALYIHLTFLPPYLPCYLLDHLHKQIHSVK